LIESVERAKKRRQEAEEGLAEKTEVLQGAENILNFVLPRYAAIKENMDTCHDYHGPSAVTAAEPIWLELLKLEKRGIKIRFLTDITKENITACKKFLTLKTSELRHLAGVKGNYAIADRKEYFENTISKGNEQPAHGIFTTVRGIVDSRQFLFDTLWSKGVPAEDRMKEIEKGIQPSFTETVRDPPEIDKIGFDLVKSAKEEIQVMFSTANTFLSGVASSIRILELLASKIRTEDSLKVRILIPVYNDSNDPTIRVENYFKEEQDNRIKIQYLDLDLDLQTTFSILMIDTRYLLVVEYNTSNDTISDSYKSVAMATYSNSEATVLSYASIFETLWVKSELAKQSRF
jgi:two-component system sensor histidine kinase VicK